MIFGKKSFTLKFLSSSKESKTCDCDRGSPLLFWRKSVFKTTGSFSGSFCHLWMNITNQFPEVRGIWKS